MKNYENFDNLFFVKILCIIAAIALVLVVAVSIIGFIKGDVTVKTDGDAETYVFDDSDIETDESTSFDTEAENTDSAITEAENIPEVTSSELSSEPAEADISDEPVGVELGESEDMGEEYIDSITFLGDSTTYGLKAYQMLRDGRNTKQVWTAKSATLSLNEILTKNIVYPEAEKEMTIAEAASLAKPRILIITLGVEGVAFLDKDGFKEQYTSLVDAIKEASPDTKIILQSIFPVAANIEGKLSNALIDEGNIWVREVAEETGVGYLDTQTVLKGDDGALNPDYDNGGNGINLNEQGFEAVLGYIRSHGLK